jgi:apurinic endonuclease APN1
MADLKPLIGYHIGKTKGGKTFLESLQKHVSQGLTAFQVNMTPPDNWYPGIPFDEIYCKQIKEYTAQHKIYAVVHGKYLYNFCRQNSGNGVDKLVDELKLSNAINCDLVIHQGKNMADEKLTRMEALHNYAKHISEALERTYDYDHGVLLENSCQAGAELGYEIKELAYIYQQFDDSAKPRVGFCLDTCHAFVAGQLDLRSASKVEQYFKQWDEEIGLDKLKVIHWNDSMIPFDGHADRHADIGAGYITNPQLGGNSDGMKRLAQLAHQHQIPIVFETPSDFDTAEENHYVPNQVVQQLKIVKAWVKSDDSEYDLFIQTYSELQQKAFAKYSAKAKKKVAVKAKAVTEIPQCNCGHEEIVMGTPIVKPSEPKIKLKLKATVTV